MKMRTIFCQKEKGFYYAFMHAYCVCACVCACVCVSNFNKRESSRFNITAAALFVVDRGLWRGKNKEEKKHTQKKRRHVVL